MGTGNGARHRGKREHGQTALTGTKETQSSKGTSKDGRRGKLGRPQNQPQEQATMANIGRKAKKDREKRAERRDQENKARSQRGSTRTQASRRNSCEEFTENSVDKAKQGHEWLQEGGKQNEKGGGGKDRLGRRLFRGKIVSMGR